MRGGVFSPPAVRAVCRLVLRWISATKGASLALAVMISVPVAATLLSDVLSDAQRGNPRRTIEQNIGQAAARVTDAGFGDVPILQNLDGTQVRPAPPAEGTPEHRHAARPELPPGALVLTMTRSLLTTQTGSTRLSTQFQELDYPHPLARGITEQLRGRAPKGPDEVAASPEFLRRAGIDLGATVAVPAAGRSFLIVGEAQPTRDHGELVLFAQPGALYEQLLRAAPADAPRLGGRMWLVDKDIDWAGVLAANEHGLAVYSRGAVLAPPPPEKIPLPGDPPGAYRSFHDLLIDDLTGGHDRSQSTGERLGMLLAGIAVVQVILLGGAMFAVGIRLGRRQLGALAANGASGGQLVLLLMVWGLLLGLGGAVLGCLAGTGAAAVLIEVFLRFDLPQIWRFQVGFDDLLMPVALGLFTGVAAAVVPAVRAGRTRAGQLLAERRSDRRPSRVTPVLGGALVLSGLMVAAAAAFFLDWRGLVPVATVLISVGLFCCFPALVGRIASLAPALPVSVRIALRELGRHRARSAPAIAAVMVVVIGTIALDTLDATRNAYTSGRYWPTLPDRHAAVLIADAATRPAGLDVLRDSLGEALPVRSFAEVTALPGAWDTCGAGGCPRTVEVAMAPSAGCGPDWTTREQWLPPGGPDCVHHRRLLGAVVVGDAELLRRVSGIDDPAAAAALARGEAVVLDSRYVQDGRTRFVVNTPQGSHELALPAMAVDSEVGSALVVLPPRTAERLGVPVSLRALDIELDRRLSGFEQDRVGEMVSAAGLSGYVERGDTREAALFALLLLACTALLSTTAAVTATVLSLIDTQRHSVMLATVGATVRTRRALAVAQSLIISGLGSVLGVLVGILPAAMISAQGARRMWREGPVALPYELVLPWPVIGFVLVVVPAIAALVALACVRGRVRIARRHT
ncbi:ABC transporter permease [Crossiella cryophila]|uniref:Putative ABC transport system permease protein n=1 Tax=Crossiella cryophila TaxID=43355 RepID=A0A7W7CHL2_9PSEU|nr:ABC transporter permease [Crossiella cryophila]MBB4681388.1 putative ABC transport system permease protein [Crossiella cryophila]